ncbi:tryptophan--tRNA ligase [Nonomuraea muscovyensis]|jgi:tryptophanyl-tRNA synthetase|uniref:Tryptophan--tRNA ligase n=1 Tax=Nonomuraea muscovyensis TaxID=1124761 RepID=A0A7X0BY14_9ACTN|nr:tryptophan--tRNA ligase [Nonomuraea muscovyensis]MBB6344812.1 tryptophanyl-tRNA synthetase [Nonomuraea muscovyensis]MDF2710412.1 trpS [Nonomuraea muscovyensis]
MDHIVLTGDRPTGPLHLGHYFGSLANRVALQHAHPMYVLVADYQVITDRDLPGAIQANITGLLLDYLAVGLDPAKVTIFQHSAVPELNQLLLPFLSLVSVAELRRNPTVKDEIAHSSQRAVSGLMFTYPVHQAADVLFCKGTLVPVGKDQLPHLEVTRMVARRFNERYGPVFPLPEAMLGDSPLLRGLDGGKMSKSRGNAISLSATEDETAALIRKARTDSDRLITFDEAARPEVATLLTLAGLCLGRTPQDVAAEIGDGGAVTLKKVVTEAVNEFLRPIRARRAELTEADVRAVLRAGNERARERAVVTLEEVRDAMGF